MTESLRRTVLISAMPAPGVQQAAGQALLVGQRHAGDRLHQQRRRAARQQHDAAVFRPGIPRQLKDARTGGDTRGIGNRMSGLQDLDARRLLTGPKAMAMARHHGTVERPEPECMVVGRQRLLPSEAAALPAPRTSVRPAGGRVGRNGGRQCAGSAAARPAWKSRVSSSLSAARTPAYGWAARLAQARPRRAARCRPGIRGTRRRRWTRRRAGPVRPILLERGQRVAAAGHTEGLPPAGGCGHGLGHPLRAPAELVDLKDPDGTVPDDGPGPGDEPGIELGGARARCPG